jgi:uncharacterized SAM-binding protein YcdF (DUF218 family)
VFFVLSKVLDIFLCPYTWGVLLLAASVPWRRRSARRWRRRRAFGVAALAVLLLGGLTPLSNALMWRLEHSTRSTFRGDVTYDAVVLLGGLVDEETTAESGRPSYNDSVERLIVTYELLRDGHARSVIVSAGTNPVFPDHGEAVVIARQLEDWGIAKDRIILEEKALNTRENAVYSRQIVKERGFSRVLVVTSAFHMPRAEACFAAVNTDGAIEVDTLAVDYRGHPRAGARLGDWIPRVDGLDGMSGTLHEIFGRLVYRVMGYARSTSSS